MQDTDDEGLAKVKLVDLASDSPPLYEAAQNWFLQQGPTIASALAEGLEDEKLGAVCHWRILLLLRYFAQEESLPVILKALRLALLENNPTVISGAMESLAVFHTPDSINTLVSLLQEQNADIVQHAAVLLGQVGDLCAIEPLLELLKSNNPFIRYSAVKGLLLLDTQVVRAALKRHEERETDSEVRALLSKAL